MDTLKRILVKNGRLHPFWRVLLYLTAFLVVVLLFSFLAFAVYGIVLAITGNTAEIEQLMAGQITPGSKLISELAMLAGVVPMTWLSRRFLDGQSFVSLGFRRRGPWLLDSGLGVILGFVLMALIFVVEVVVGWLQVDGLAWTIQGVMAVVITVLIYLVVYLLVGISEELVFRGYTFVNLREGFGVIVAVIVSSVLFGLLHALNPNFGPVALLNTALVGVFFCYAYLVTDNLWLPIAYHFSWNFCQGTVFSFPVSGTGGEGLFLTSLIGGPDWVTGGNYGPEAGLLGTAAILASFLVVWLWARVRVT